MSDKQAFRLGILLFLSMLILWALAASQVPTEQHQGDVYKILYIHVPSAFSCFFCAFVLFVMSMVSLVKKPLSLHFYAKASAEVGLLFTVLTLMTGSIWGKPTWGTWWTWDARLTTTLILALLYAGYLILDSSLPSMHKRKACAVLGIIIFCNIPIIYQSVTWWRTLHQPPSLMRSDGPTMAKEIVFYLCLGIFLEMIFACWLIWQRGINLLLRQQIEETALLQMNTKRGL